MPVINRTTIDEILESMLSTKQVAEKFGVNIRDVQYYIKQGRIRAYRWGYFYLIHRGDLPSEWPPPEV